MRPSKRATQRGFTLLEVLVALVIVALGMSALLEMLSQSASNVSALRDKTVAEWIALNQIALARLNLNVPTTGTTQGDIQSCGNGSWHWQQQVTAVDAVPGLLSITVSVQRTGNATAPQQLPDLPASGNGLGANGSLGANATLGPTAQLGSVTSLSTSGCSSVTAAGNSLGGSLGGSLGNNSGPSLPSTPSLGNNTFGSGSLGSTEASDNLNASLSHAMGGGAASNGGSNGSAAQASWLVTLTGFRGNALGPSSGEGPDWNGTAATAAATGNTTATPNITPQSAVATP
jgi:general secretion pathway protein I